jgi:hypothetical protein
MDSTLAGVTVFALRILERCTGVVIGGIAIYLGYLLFLKVPDRNVSGGEVSVLDTRIVLSRVGPGVFFALFGAGVLALSLYRPVLFERDAARVRVEGAGPPQARNDSSDLRDARTLMRSDIAILNTLSRQLDPKLSEENRNSAESAIQRIKLELMEPVWVDDDWGNRLEFKKWVEDGARDPVPVGLEPAAKYFRDPYGS